MTITDKQVEAACRAYWGDAFEDDDDGVIDAMLAEREK